MQHVRHLPLAALLALLAVPASARSFTDLTPYGGQFCYSPASPFTGADVGQSLTITGGTGWRHGVYTIKGVQPYPSLNIPGNPPLAQLDRPTAGGAADGQGSTGPYAPPTPPDPNTIVHIGDSISAGYLASAGAPEAAEQAAYAAQGRTVTEATAAYNGTSSDSWANGGYFSTFAAPLIRNAYAGTVEIMLGTNDASAGSTVAAYDANMTALVAAAHAAGASNVVLLQIPFLVPNAQWTAASVALIQQYNASLASIPGATVGGGGDFAWFRTYPQRLKDGTHPTAAGYADLGTLWAGAVPPTPPALPALTPSGTTLGPTTTLQLGVSNLAGGVTVTGWSITGTPPAGVTLSASGLLTYGPAVHQLTPLALSAALSDGSAVTGSVTLSPTAETGQPDSAGLDTGVYNGTIGPASNTYLTNLIKNFGIPAIMIALTLCAWLLVRHWARSVAR